MAIEVLFMPQYIHRVGYSRLHGLFKRKLDAFGLFDSPFALAVSGVLSGFGLNKH